jgi:hypothetical protein
MSYLDSSAMDTKGSIEIACDESGSEGENLVSGDVCVFAHGSTDMSRSEAGELISLLQKQVGFEGRELKSSHLLSERHLKDTLRLFEPGGALDGRAKVSLTDKAYIAVCKVVDLVIEEHAYRNDIHLHESGAARQIARDLFSEGPRAYGADTWNRLLRESVSSVRATQRKGVKTTHEELLNTIDDLWLRSHRKRWRELCSFCGTTTATTTTASASATAEKTARPRVTGA